MTSARSSDATTPTHALSHAHHRREETLDADAWRGKADALARPKRREPKEQEANNKSKKQKKKKKARK